MKNDVFISSPDSKNEYYPCILCNGEDSILIDYGGSSFLSLNDHTHAEQNQGSACGWYKLTHRNKRQVLQPICAAGVQIIAFGAPAEPEWYVQSFNPKTATVTTKLDFRRGISFTIESFLTDDGLWCEKITADCVPNDIEVSVGLKIIGANCQIRTLTYQNPCSLKSTSMANEIDFEYICGEYFGKGFLASDVDFDKTVYSDDGGCEGIYNNVEEGFCVIRKMAIAEDKDADRLNILKNKCRDYQNTVKEHKRIWKEYFDKSSVWIPNKEIRSLYELSRYIIRAHQNKDTGIIPTGAIPNLWGGGTYCTYDADFSFRGLLSSGNIDEALLYLKSFEIMAQEGYDTLSANGYNGTTFLGWQNVCGEYVGHLDNLIEAVVNFKPCYGAFAVFTAYELWKLNKNFLSDSIKKIIRDCIIFIEENMLEEKGDTINIISVKAGTEAGFDVEVDTYTQLLFSNCFLQCGEIFEDEKLIEKGNKLLKSLEGNFDDSGVILPFRNASYYGGMQCEYFYLNPDFIGIKSVIETDIAGKTKWGYDSTQTTEVYRHWPWNDTKYSRAYTIAGDSKRSMIHLLHSTYAIASSGAFPEKIRLDGKKIGYWYTSPHALLVEAVNVALAFAGNDNNIVIGSGIDKPWTSFKCRDIVVNNGLKVSYEMKNNKLIYLKLVNISGENKEIRIDMPDRYDRGECGKTVFIGAGEKFVYTK